MFQLLDDTIQLPCGLFRDAFIKRCPLWAVGSHSHIRFAHVLLHGSSVHKKDKLEVNVC